MSRLSEVEAMIGQWKTYDRWVLLPHPIPSLATPAKRKEWEQVIEKARVELHHEKWDDAQTAVRDLSDVGGVLSVDIIRVRHIILLNSRWIDGKKVIVNGTGAKTP